MPALRSLFVLLALVTAASSCVEPLQSGGVIVQPGAQARLDAMCRYHGAAQACAPPDDE